MRGALFTLTLFGALLGAQVAQAGTVSKTGSVYSYSPTNGDADVSSQTVRLLFCTGGMCSGDAVDHYLISENGSMPSAAPGSGCFPRALSPGVFLQCPAGATRWTINLAGGADSIATQDCCGTMNVPVDVFGGPGNDTISTGPHDDVVDGGADNDTLSGVGGNDTLNGGDGTDTLNGGDHNDTLDGGLGSDTINGGAGTGDVVSYASRSDGVTVNLGTAGADDGSAGDGSAGSRDTVNNTDIEGIAGSQGGDILNGNSLGFPLTIEGQDGGDSISGGSGPNTLRGEQGNDNLTGGSDPDTLEGGDGADSINGFAGADVVRGGTGFDSIEARDGIADDVDCGPDFGSAFTDSVDTRTNCDPPATNTSGGSGSGTPAPTTPTPLRLTLGSPTISGSFGRRSTKLKKLVARGVPAGSKLTATCKTKQRRRCPRTRNFTKANAGGNVRLRSFERKSLPVGGKLEIRATKPGTIGAVKILTIRKAKKPSVATRCLQPGASRPAKC